MKKFLALCLTLCLALGLAACGSSGEQLQIGIPADATNGARALLLLQDLGIITLNDGVGLEATEKAVLFCVAARSPKLVRQAARELWLDIPGRGVLMAVPVNGIGGATTKEYLLHEQEGEASMEQQTTHELIVVITNQGYTDLVMDAAHSISLRMGYRA